MSLQGKLALVTGSGRGIGRAVALKLASQGSDIVINFFRHRQSAEQTAQDVEALGVKVEVIRANVGDPSKIKEMFDTITSKFGYLDILLKVVLLNSRVHQALLVSKLFHLFSSFGDIGPLGNKNCWLQF